jgi:ketosteroid isomerase-like protein
MRRMLLVGVTALLIGFATARGSGALAQSSDEEGVRAAVSAFYAALNARDIQAMEALWAPDANVIMIHPGGPTARAPADRAGGHAAELRASLAKLRRVVGRCERCAGAGQPRAGRGAGHHSGAR